MMHISCIKFEVEVAPVLCHWISMMITICTVTVLFADLFVSFNTKSLRSLILPHQLTFTRGSAPYCGGACQWQKHFSTSSICDLKWFGTGKTWLYPRGWADGYSWTSGGRNSYFIGTVERPRTVGRCLLSRNIIKSFTIHPKPSHFQILRCLLDTSMKQEPIRQTDRGKLLSMKKHL